MNTPAGTKESELVMAVLLYAIRCLAEGDYHALRGMNFGPEEVAGGLLSRTDFRKRSVNIWIQIDPQGLGFNGGYILKGKFILLHASHNGIFTETKLKRLTDPCNK